MPTANVIMPTGASSNIENGSWPYRVIAPLTARFVDVPMSVQLPPRIAPKASGISSFEGGIFDLAARPITTGKNIAAVVVFFSTEADTAAVTIIKAVNTNSLSPDIRPIRRPMTSTIPVLVSPPTRINSPPIVIITSLPNPATASPTVSTRVKMSAITRIMPMTSTGSFSVANKTIATSSKISVIAIGDMCRKEYPNLPRFERKN